MARVANAEAVNTDGAEAFCNRLVDVRIIVIVEAKVPVGLICTLISKRFAS